MAKRNRRRTTDRHKPGYDYHHILFQGRHWKQGWAHTLRHHRYCGMYIPQQTLHRIIHAKIHDIPTPHGKECRQAVEALNSWLEAGYISLDDRLDKRIENIAKCFRAKCPATTAMLDWQHDIVSKFYGGGE